MAKKVKTGLEVLLSELEMVDEGLILARAKESPAKAKDADKKFTEYGRDALLNDPLENGSPRYTEEQFNALSEEDQKNKADEGARYRVTRKREDAVRTLAKDPDKVLKRDGNYDSKLVNIANTKDIMERVDNPDERKLLEDHSRYIDRENAVKRVKDGKLPEGMSKEDMNKLAANASYERAYASRKKAGATDKEADMAGKLARPAPSEDIFSDANKPYLVKAISKMRDETEAGIKRTYGDNYREKIAEIAGKRIATMAKSGDPEEEGKALNLLYNAANGYSIGERSYSEAFGSKK